MKATYRKAGFNYLPAIKHNNGATEVIYGNPVCNITTAKKYAELEIHNRHKEGAK